MSEKKRNPYLSVLLSDEDRKMLDEIVRKKYLNQSDAIRAMIRDAYNEMRRLGGLNVEGGDLSAKN